MSFREITMQDVRELLRRHEAGQSARKIALGQQGIVDAPLTYLPHLDARRSSRRTEALVAATLGVVVLGATALGVATAGAGGVQPIRQSGMRSGGMVRATT